MTLNKKPIIGIVSKHLLKEKNKTKYVYKR